MRVLNKMLRINFTTVSLGAGLFLGTLLAEKILGFASYIYLALTSPILIISSFMDSAFFFYFILFLYYLFAVWFFCICSKKGKMIFMTVSAIFLTMHIASCLYVKKLVAANIGTWFVERFICDKK